MEGFFNTLKSSGLVDAVKDMALDALHLNDDKKEENVDSKPRRHESSSSWGPTPQEAESGDSQPEWRRPRPARNDDDESSQSEWQRPRPSRNEDEESSGWRRPRPEREEERPSGGNWAQVVGDQEDGNQGGGRRQGNDGWQPAGRKQRPHRHPNDEQAEEYRHDASAQHYADEASANVEPTEEELADLSAACNRLWELDLNRLTPGQDYEIDCGDGKKLYNKEDMSGDSLFKFLDEGVFKRPTYARFYHLLDNYHADESKREELSATEEQEQVAFLEEISRTAPIKYLLRYLAEKRIVSGNMEEFKQTLRTLWFRFYNRGGTQNASSAFEHVFVGEIKRQGEVSGFHNWIQFYVEESKGTVDYQGYILPRRRGGDLPDSQSQLLTVQFDWNGVRKEQSSVMVGVSPEFELALYTLCFYVGEENNNVDLGPYRVNVKCYHMGEDRIGSVFPIALD
ncbi:hypothetical protein KC19_2G252400 [Ceratodon purpureus]|uniref:EndoU domain-containing protein n=1 Tax=Ceratodon purpureus TaxID=3225 RepID=A0A8T0J013_CERPU|nr:hypothetical protein KC19_2G252400 [Ceratodon purpureus]